ncbi:MAG TPA: hypothetical protein VEY30_07515, partial [Myxococcaceae bacterium]|nr:hypothetical protein [Myxococcaceae bacterium]
KAHNQALTLAAELGGVGLALFLLTALSLFSRFTHGRTPSSTAGASLVYFAALSVTHDPLFHVPFSLALTLALAAGIRTEVLP